jgi:hypothetical protein
MLCQNILEGVCVGEKHAEPYTTAAIIYERQGQLEKRIRSSM